MKVLESDRPKAILRKIACNEWMDDAAQNVRRELLPSAFVRFTKYYSATRTSPPAPKTRRPNIRNIVLQRVSPRVIDPLCHSPFSREERAWTMTTVERVRLSNDRSRWDLFNNAAFGVTTLAPSFPRHSVDYGRYGRAISVISLSFAPHGSSTLYTTEPSATIYKKSTKTKTFDKKSVSSD